MRFGLAIAILIRCSTQNQEQTIGRKDLRQQLDRRCERHHSLRSGLWRLSHLMSHPEAGREQVAVLRKVAVARFAATSRVASRGYRLRAIVPIGDKLLAGLAV